MVDTALDLFQRRQSAGRATVLIFYRGERSFFCKQWLRRWLSIPGFDRRLDLADVFLLFVSSQSQGKAYSVADQIAGRKAILDTRVFFFGDPEHLLVDYLAESGLTHPVVTNPDSHRAHGWVFDYGMVQPAVLAIAADASVLYEWTSKPSLLNGAGKLDRPDPWDVWDKIEQRIDRIRITKARAARRAIAAASSAVRATKETSTISSEGQSRPNTPEASASAATPARRAPRDSTLPNAAQLSLKSLASAQQLLVPQPESPMLTESPEKEPKSAEEDREDETKPAPTPRHLGEGDSSANDTFSFAGLDGNLPKAGSDGEELTTAPPSTGIDTLTVDTLKTPLSQEERDSSEDDMSNMRVQQLSASINALASEVLADKNLSLTEPEPETVAKLPKLAEEVVRSHHQPEPLTDDELEREIGDIVDGTVRDHDDPEDRHEAPKDEPIANVGSSTREENVQDSEAARKVGQTFAYAVRPQTDQHVVRFSEPLPKAQTENDVGATASKTSIPRLSTLKEDPANNAEANELDTSTSDDAIEFETVTSKEASASVSFEVSRTSELFDPQSSVGDTLETSAASLGSDQVDSTAIIVKHASVRTEDSTQINSLAGFEVSSFPSERRIPEEAEDKKTGISDYLKELKDPSKLKDPSYRCRYDPLPPIKPPGRSNLRSATGNRPRPSSVSGYSYARDVTISANVGLAQGLIQQETRMPPSETNRRDSTRRSRESRVSQRTVPPVAVYIADKEPATPPHIARSPVSGQSSEPMTASPHPEIHRLSRTGTIDISPFADADLEMTLPEDLGTKSSLRDEYEAYDEYIVCEYEVEEYVEEYESDAFSKSKIFVTTVVDDSSQDGSIRTASDGRTLNEVHHFDHCNVVDVKGTAREADADGRVRVWKESGARPTAAVSPTVEANMLHRQAGNHTMSPVQVLLRKMGVKGARRARGTEEGSLTEEPAHTPARDAARISRKDTFRAVLRKTPRDRVSSGDAEETAEADEEEAKLGRKETIKSVLRKIPVPKNLKRAQTEVAIGGEVDEERATAPVEEESNRPGRRSGLQAVLQRLPSLSSANRHRGGVRVETMSPVTSTTEIAENTELETGPEPKAGARDTTTVTEATHGEKPGVFRRTFSRLAQTEEAGSGRGDASGVETGATAGGSGALDGRRKVTWGEDGEKVGGKMSFAVVGGRILSKFKM